MDEKAILLQNIKDEFHRQFENPKKDFRILLNEYCPFFVKNIVKFSEENNNKDLLYKILEQLFNEKIKYTYEYNRKTGKSRTAITSFLDVFNNCNFNTDFYKNDNTLRKFMTIILEFQEKNNSQSMKEKINKSLVKNIDYCFIRLEKLMGDKDKTLEQIKPILEDWKNKKICQFENNSDSIKYYNDYYQNWQKNNGGNFILEQEKSVLIKENNLLDDEIRELHQFIKNNSENVDNSILQDKLNKLENNIEKLKANKNKITEIEEKLKEHMNNNDDDDDDYDGDNDDNDNDNDNNNDDDDNTNNKKEIKLPFAEKQFLFNNTINQILKSSSGGRKTFRRTKTKNKKMKHNKKTKKTRQNKKYRLKSNKNTQKRKSRKSKKIQL